MGLAKNLAEDLGHCRHHLIGETYQRAAPLTGALLPASWGSTLQFLKDDTTDGGFLHHSLGPAASSEGQPRAQRCGRARLDLTALGSRTLTGKLSRRFQTAVGWG